MQKIELLKRIFRTQVKRYISQILIIFLFIFVSALATAGVAWLLDPAIKKIFIEKDVTLLFVIPGLIVLAFVIKSISIYIIRIKTIKKACFGMRADRRVDMGSSVLHLSKKQHSYSCCL